MIVIKASEGKEYEAKNHFNMWGIRKFGPPEGAKSVNLSVSEFLPNGGATMSSSDKERFYYVLRGSITVRNDAGTEFVLEENDVIYIPPDEKREVIVNGLIAARILVIVSNA